MKKIECYIRDADVTPLTVDQFTTYVNSEREKYEKYLQIIKQSGVTPE